jgi:predicted Rossmann-fold nucleotide-binding protein
LHFSFFIYKIFSSFPSFILNPYIHKVYESVAMAGFSGHQIKNICVFGGSSPGKEKEFLESANPLSQVLAKRKIHLVYGGGSLGLIGSVSTAAFLRSSQVLGIIPKALAKVEIIEKIVGEELHV